MFTLIKRNKNTFLSDVFSLVVRILDYLIQRISVRKIEKSRLFREDDVELNPRNSSEIVKANRDLCNIININRVT